MCFEINKTIKASLQRIICCTLLFLSLPLSAQNIVVDYDEEKSRPSKMILPYALATESLGVALGVGGGMSGYMQPQTSFFVTASASTKVTYTDVLADGQASGRVLAVN